MLFTTENKDLARTCIQDAINHFNAHPLRNSEKPNLKENFDVAIFRREVLIERLDELFYSRTIASFEFDLLRVSIMQSIEYLMASLTEFNESVTEDTINTIKERRKLLSMIMINIRVI